MGLIACTCVRAVKMSAIICFGYGKDITLTSANRLNLLSPSNYKTLLIWKRLTKERLNELGLDVEMIPLANEQGTAGKICRLCSSALQRFDKLECSTKTNLNEALDIIINDSDFLQSALDKSIDEPLSLTKQVVPSVDDEKSPSVAVSQSISFL